MSGPARRKSGICRASRRSGPGCAVLLGIAPVARASATDFRPFADTSPWNTPAAPKGYVQANNPYAAELGSAGKELGIEGIPPDIAYSKPIFFAQPGDP